MPEAPRPTVKEIKDQHPLQDVLPRYMDLRRSGDCLVGRCPFHEDRSPSFAAYLKTQTWQCFAASCGLGGDVIDFIGRQAYGLAWNSHNADMFKAALLSLTGERLPPLRRAVPDDWRQASDWRPMEITPQVQMLLHSAASLYHSTLLARGRGPSSPYAYLRDARGFNDNTIRWETLGYAEGGLLVHALGASGFTPEAGQAAGLLNERGGERMAGRIVFVERDRSGRVLHLIGRKYAEWLGEAAPKYLSLKEMTKPLYGYAQLDKRQNSAPVILVESPPDAITARQWGRAALANCGTQLKFDHAARLASLRRPLIYLPHNDGPADNPTGGPGWKAAEKWKSMIGQGQIVPLPDSVKDLNELGVKPGGREELEARLKQFGYEPLAPPEQRPSSSKPLKSAAELLLDASPIWSV